MQEPSEPSEQLREVIRAAYRQGEEAVIALVENLLKAQADAIGKLESRMSNVNYFCRSVTTIFPDREQKLDDILE